MPGEPTAPITPEIWSLHNAWLEKRETDPGLTLQEFTGHNAAHVAEIARAHRIYEAFCRFDEARKTKPNVTVEEYCENAEDIPHVLAFDRNLSPPPLLGEGEQPALPPDTRQYKFLAKIGQGGVGVVYRAFDTRLNREVAIKVLHQRPYDWSTAKRSFRQEIHLSNQLAMAGIVPIFDIGELPNQQLYIVMQLVKGQRPCGWRNSCVDFAKFAK
jgi:hypothetical protein